MAWLRGWGTRVMHGFQIGWTAGMAGVLSLASLPSPAFAAPSPDDRADSYAQSTSQAPVSAHDHAPPPSPAAKPQRDIYAGDYFIVGVGAAVLPAYEGSHRHHV